jgi:hypothetical protein
MDKLRRKLRRSLLNGLLGKKQIFIRTGFSAKPEFVNIQGAQESIPRKKV